MTSEQAVRAKLAKLDKKMAELREAKAAIEKKIEQTYEIRKLYESRLPQAQ